MLNWLKKPPPDSENTPLVPPTKGVSDGSSFTASLSSEFPAHMKRGNESLAQGLLKEATRCYRQAVGVNPGHAEGYLNLGFVLKEQNLHAEAELALKQAVLLDPEMADAYYLLATTAQELGKPDEAVGNYNRTLELKPDFEMAYRDLSLALFQNGQITGAETTLQKAIALYPANADFHYYLNKIYANQGEADKALACLLKVLSLQPEFAEGHNEMGLALQAQDKLDAAIQSFQRAISLKPDYAEAHSNLGIAFQKQGKWEMSIASYRNAIAIDPAYAIVHNNLASALQKLDDLEGAIAHLQKAIKINPRYAEAHSNLGVALKSQGKLEAAVKCCQMALSINPDLADAHGNLADALQVWGRLDASVESYHRALALKPESAGSHNNLGNAYRTQGKFDAAAEQYRLAISLQPDFANAHLNLGLTLIDQGLHDRAIQCFQDAIALNPANADAHLSLSLCQLLLGDFGHGWPEFEWRWQGAHMHSVKYVYPQPLWLGKEPLAGKTILLHHEQGFGDTIQFCRYVKLVAAQGATVLLLVPAALKSLLVGLEGVRQVLAEGEPLPAFDYHCPLMSLPLAFSTQIDTIPSADAYLGSDPAHISKWQGKLGNKARPRVGLVWAGNQTHKNDINRSIPLNDLFGIMTDQVQLVSLQKEMRPQDQTLLNDKKHIAHFGAELDDFTDTAGLIANMDLVISVDTATAHLAGAMGKPVWVLLPFNPDWRWMLQRDDSPWYPSARLFRQTKIGDWDSVLSSVAEELKNIKARA